MCAAVVTAMCNDVSYCIYKAARRQRRRQRKQDAAPLEAGQQDCGHLPAPDRPASRLQLAQKRLRRWAAWSSLLAHGLLVRVAFHRWHKVGHQTCIHLKHTGGFKGVLMVSNVAPDAAVWAFALRRRPARSMAMHCQHKP